VQRPPAPRWQPHYANGIIENERSLRAELQAEGVVCKSETDNYVIHHLPEGEGAVGPLVALPLDEAFYGGVERIQVLACGTSRHASQVWAYLLEHLAGISTSVFYASEFRTGPPPLSANTLTIGVTQSGETADTLAALAMEQERRQPLLERGAH